MVAASWPVEEGCSRSDDLVAEHSLRSVMVGTFGGLVWSIAPYSSMTVFGSLIDDFRGD